MKSRFDPTRDTVGKMARDAIINHDGYPVINADLTRELEKSLSDDLNEAFGSNPYGNKPFYVLVHESKDLKLNNMIKRRIVKLAFRPWPEDDTIVFWHDPSSCTTLFCWCLPHWSEMDNMLANPALYNHDMLEQIKAWKAVDLKAFGFINHGKDIQGKDVWLPDPNFKDQPLVYRRR